MMSTSTAREALIIEAIGEVARLIGQVEALAPEMLKTGHALRKSDAQLHQTLAGFEARLASITERTKTQAVQHLEAQMSASAQHLVGRLCAALIEAAHQAFQNQIGATTREQQVVLNNLRGLLHQLTQERAERWVRWATYAAATSVGSALTLLALWLSR
jgi:hypothetical protein